MENPVGGQQPLSEPREGNYLNEGQRWVVGRSKRVQSHLIFDVTEQSLEFFFKLSSDAGAGDYGGQIY